MVAEAAVTAWLNFTEVLVALFCLNDATTGAGFGAGGGYTPGVAQIGPEAEETIFCVVAVQLAPALLSSAALFSSIE
ncbi:hypothetical protein D3C72_851760 [compost metagenome]